jgi:uncharacterized DUF497 family protein
MDYSLMEFEWDYSKEAENLRKHRVSFAEAVETFSDPRGLVLEDENHSSSEDRFYWVGKSGSARILTTRFTRRGNKIRIIGCAEWRRFKVIYYEAAKVKESKN